MRYLGCQQAEDQAKAEGQKKEEKEEGGEEKGTEEEEGGKHEEATADKKLRAQLEKLADQVRASSCVEEGEYGQNIRTDWTETESDKELRKALEVAIEKKVSLKELNFSCANLAKMK